MSARSVRRAAEMAVIDAAARYVDLECDADEIENAVHNLRALGLEPATKTRTSRGAPVTSHMAAAYVHGRYSTSLVGRIVARLAGRSGFTTEELCERLNARHQSVSARVNELRDNGWIVDSGEIRKTRSGQDATVWKISTVAQRLLEPEIEVSWQKAGLD